MISTVQPLYVGNALRLFIEPPPGAVQWKVLRKGSASFSGHDDPSALVAYQGDDRVIVDVESLQNDVAQFYCPFYTSDGQSWTAGQVAHGTPRSTYQETSTDVLGLVRDRLAAGLKVECDRGNFATELGYIQVYTAPPMLERDLRFPLVTVHVEHEKSSERGIGEDIVGSSMDSIDGMDWQSGDGWLADVELTIIGWSENSDERNELRKAIRRIIQANLQIFAQKGMEQISINQGDVNAIDGEYPSPLFMVNTSLTCIAPVLVAGDEGETVSDVPVSPVPY